jgi:hypothetical protein
MMRRPPHPTTFITFIALTVCIPAQSWAQTVESFDDLALQIDLEDRIRIEDQSRMETVGRLTHLSRDAIALHTAAGERRFPPDAVRSVARGDHPIGRGALVGAGIGAVLGAVVNCSRNGRRACFATGAIGAAPVGAGIGLTIGALTSRMRVVYQARNGRPSDQPSGSPIGGPASLLEDLALRANLDDQLRVGSGSGPSTVGRLVRLTANEITLDTAAGERHFTREAIRQVVVRRHPLRMAVLVGAGIGAAVGAIAGCAGPGREECADAPIIVGAFGAGLGLAVGTLIHKTTAIYPDPERQTSIVPAISHGRVGVQLSRRWQ